MSKRIKPVLLFPHIILTLFAIGYYANILLANQGVDGLIELNSNRLVILSVAILASLFSLFLTLALLLDIPKITQKVKDHLATDIIRKKVFFWLSVSGYFTWIISMLPAYQFGRFSGYWDNIHPFFLLLSLHLFYLLFMMELVIVRNFKFQLVTKIPLKTWGSILILSNAVLLLILKLIGNGVLFDTALWNVAGVPIPISAIYTLVGIIVFLPAFIKVYKFQFEIHLSPIFWVLALWFITYLVIEPLPITRNWFVHTPSELGGSYYPVSDARIYTLSGKAMINGLGLDFGSASQKPFFDFYLGILQFFAGVNYENIISLHILILCFIPPLIFLIGREIESAEFGLMLSSFAIIAEVSANHSSGYIANLHWKLLVPEPLLMLILLLVAWFAIKWMKSGSIIWLMIVGALSGIGTFIKPHTAFAFVGIMILVIIQSNQHWKERIRIFLISSLSFITVTLPWMIYTGIVYRYIPLLDKFLFIFSDRLNVTAQQPHLANTSVEITTPLFPKVIETIRIIVSHFFNNYIRALLTLPYSFKIHSIPEVFDSITYWNETGHFNWDGSVTFVFLVFFSIFIIGLILHILKHRLAGMIPFVIMTGVFIALGISRTSGSRYLVPVNWVITYYFIYGIYSIALLLQQKHILEVNRNNQANNETSKPTIRTTFIILIVIGLLFPLLDFTFPTKQELIISNSEVDQLLQKLNPNQQFNYPNDFSTSLLKEKGQKIAYGEILYPIIQEWNESSRSVNVHFAVFGKPRLADANFTFPLEVYKSLDFQNEYLVLACKQTGAWSDPVYMFYDQENDATYYSEEAWDYCRTEYFEDNLADN